MIASDRRFQLNADTYQTDGKLQQIREERGYSYEDEVGYNYNYHRSLSTECAISDHSIRLHAQKNVCRTITTN